MRKSAKKPQKELTNETDQNIVAFVNNHISQFRLTNAITFSGCEINSTFIQPFLHSTNDLRFAFYVAFLYDLSPIRQTPYLKKEQYSIAT
jgi:hypothetical protein